MAGMDQADISQTGHSQDLLDDLIADLECFRGAKFSKMG